MLEIRVFDGLPNWYLLCINEGDEWWVEVVGLKRPAHQSPEGWYQGCPDGKCSLLGDEAMSAAWAAPGVCEVETQFTVSY